MKKLTVTVVMMLALVVPVSAATTQGPCLEQGRLEVAYDMNYTQRDLKFENITANQSSIGIDNGEVTLLSHTAVISYGFSDMFEGFCRLGVNKLNHFEEYAPSQDGSAFIDEPMSAYDRPTFTWGIGGKVTVPQVFYAIDLSFGGQYNAVDWKDVDSNMLANGTAPAAIDVDMREWQFDVIASQQHGRITPYAGFRYSDAAVDMDIRSTTGAFTSYTMEYEAARNWGGVVGLDFEIDPNIGGYLEGRFVDESAFSAGLNYKF